jgi:hypothetical protein
MFEQRIKLDTLHAYHCEYCIRRLLIIAKTVRELEEHEIARPK